MKYLLFMSILLSLPIYSCRADQYSEAKNKAIQALYQYEHWDKDTNDFLQHVQTKFTPEQVKIAGFIAFATHVVIDKKIAFTWRFP